jgi:NAD(P)-dependent dehydrogenase (short-subunit alcohol dehydrogenase family)
MPSLVLTGSNRDLGLAFARQYAADGWRVHACCRAPDAAHELKAIDGDVVLHKVDLTDEASIDRLAAALKGEPVDLLLCNAAEQGARFDWGVGGTDYDFIRRQFQVNAIGPLKMVEVLTENIAVSSRKVICGISSYSGSIAKNEMGVGEGGRVGGGRYGYRASKTALNAFFHNVAIDLAPRGIIAFVLHPGQVATPAARNAPNQNRMPPAEAARHCRSVIAGVGPAASGAFLDYLGRSLPW